MSETTTNKQERTMTATAEGFLYKGPRGSMLVSNFTFKMVGCRRIIEKLPPWNRSYSCPYTREPESTILRDVLVTAENGVSARVNDVAVVTLLSSRRFVRMCSNLPLRELLTFNFWAKPQYWKMILSHARRESSGRLPDEMEECLLDQKEYRRYDAGKRHLLCEDDDPSERVAA